jgi:GAF domain-containing protein
MGSGPTRSCSLRRHRGTFRTRIHRIPRPSPWSVSGVAVVSRWHGEELLGAITLQKPRDEPVSAAEDKLLEHVASQAGLVLRNVRLTAELQATIDDLRASRRRLVKAQDEERQRIERNLHDGAQQQLVALMVQLSLLEDSAGDSGEVRQVTGQLRAGLRAAIVPDLVSPRSAGTGPEGVPAHSTGRHGGAVAALASATWRGRRRCS